MFFGFFFFFRWFFGTPFGGQRVAQGGRFETLFLTFRVSFWVPHFCIVFWLMLGCPREGKSCVFYVRVFKNRLSAYLEKVPKMTSNMPPFWYPLGAKIMFFRVPKMHWKIYPKTNENGAKSDSHLASKIDPENSNKGPHVRDRVWVPSGAPFWKVLGTVFWWFVGTFFLYFQMVC